MTQVQATTLLENLLQRVDEGDLKSKITKSEREAILLGLTLVMHSEKQA